MGFIEMNEAHVTKSFKIYEYAFKFFLPHEFNI